MTAEDRVIAERQGGNGADCLYEHSCWCGCLYGWPRILRDSEMEYHKVYAAFIAAIMYTVENSG